MIRTGRRIYKAFQGEILAIPWRLISFLFAILLFLFPLITIHPYILRIVIFTCIYAIFAVSWDLLAGYAGQTSLGHSLFFGVSAYTAALLNLNFGMRPWITVPCGAIAGTVAGLILCVPALRLRGIYFTLTTIAFPLILIGIVHTFTKVTGGELGLYTLAPLSSSRIISYYVCLLVAIGSILVMWKLSDVKSKIVRTGLILQAIREDEIAARTLAINTITFKIVVFSVSGFFAGIAGGLYAHTMRVVGPSTLELWNSIQPILWTLFGGICSIHGPVLGAVFLYPLTEFLRIVPQFRLLIFALVMVLIVLFMPEGLGVWVRDKLEEGCPRCKLTNASWRRHCRACGAPIHLER